MHAFVEQACEAHSTLWPMCMLGRVSSDVVPPDIIPRASLGELARVFLRLGVTAFGGPAAHIAMMEDEFVRRRRWLTHEKFLDLLGAANLIPGPSSTELAVYIGYEQAGWRGLLLGGACFILPAALMVGAIAWAYVRFGRLPELADMLYGIKPVVIGVIVQALWALAPKAVKESKVLGAIAVGACAASALGVDALLVLVGGGVATVLARRAFDGSKNNGAARVFLVPAAAAGAASTAVPVGLLTLFLTFVKIGALVFGSGYVLLAFLRADLVERLHWLSEPQLIDAIAVGQVTPGPVFTTATFIGYVVGGVWGAVLATLGIFLPGFVLVAITRPLIARIRRSVVAAAFLDGVNVASLSLMTVVTFQLARAALVDLPTIFIAIVGAVILIRWKVNSTWLVAGAAVIGVVTRELR
jgi:chromate transporter